MMRLRRLFWGLVVFAVLVEASAIVFAEDSWQVGIATAKITPEQPIWMAGYAGRDHFSRFGHHLQHDTVKGGAQCGRCQVLLSDLHLLYQQGINPCLQTFQSQTRPFDPGL